MVTLDGASSAHLVAGDTRWPVPGPVPPGGYTVHVGGRAVGEVTVGPGEIVRLTCDATGCRR